MFKKYFIGLMILFITLQSLLYFGTPQIALATSFGVAPPTKLTVAKVAYKNDMTKCAFRVIWLPADVQKLKTIVGYQSTASWSQMSYKVTVQEAKNGGKIIYNGFKALGLNEITSNEAVCGTNYWIKVRTIMGDVEVGSIGGTYTSARLDPVSAPPTWMTIQPNGVNNGLCSINVTWAEADQNKLKQLAGFNSNFWQIKYQLTVQSTTGKNIIYFNETYDHDNRSAIVDKLFCKSNYWINVNTLFNDKKVGTLPETYFVDNTPTKPAVTTGVCPPRNGDFNIKSYNDKGVANVQLTWENNKIAPCDTFTDTSKDNIQYTISLLGVTVPSNTLKVSYPSFSGTFPLAKTTEFTVTGRNITQNSPLGSAKIKVIIDAPTTTVAKNTDPTGDTGGTSGTTGGTTTTGGTSGASGTTAGEAESICVTNCGGVPVLKTFDAGPQIQNAMCKMQCSTLGWFSDIIQYMFTNILEKSIL